MDERKEGTSVAGEGPNKTSKSCSALTSMAVLRPGKHQWEIQWREGQRMGQEEMKKRGQGEGKKTPSSEKNGQVKRCVHPTAICSENVK